MRKRWTRKEEITPSLLKFREKRKWQISLRRYVIHESLCPDYAPYFGLDIKNMRQWFEFQFKAEGWADFGKKWQFDHIIPVTYFDFSNNEDLKLCWNFTNLRVEQLQQNKDRGNRLDVLMAKRYFRELYETTGYEICQKLLLKIETLEMSEFISTEAQQSFIRSHSDYLSMIQNYNSFEFELLNSGRTVEQVKEEVGHLKTFNK
ncbi:MAG: hypothetical protein JNM88_10095 [Chitinophagaceae bacterium]|nr:hypothetical protein [Chitinophagaceae bacterium]